MFVSDCGLDTRFIVLVHRLELRRGQENGLHRRRRPPRKRLTSATPLPSLWRLLLGSSAGRVSADVASPHLTGSRACRLLQPAYHWTGRFIRWHRKFASSVHWTRMHGDTMGSVIVHSDLGAKSAKNTPTNCDGGGRWTRGDLDDLFMYNSEKRPARTGSMHSSMHANVAPLTGSEHKRHGAPF